MTEHERNMKSKEHRDGLLRHGVFTSASDMYSEIAETSGRRVAKAAVEQEVRKGVLK